VVCPWPHRYLADERAGRVDGRTVMCVLTHDPCDVPLLEVALPSTVRENGAMGSRRTHEDRLGRLREAGAGRAAGPAALADRAGPRARTAGKTAESITRGAGAGALG
jgi:xanthine dehydrogenase accessory factor